MAKSNNERTAEFRAKQKALGRVNRNVYATSEEYILIKSMLSEFRLRQEARQLAEELK